MKQWYQDTTNDYSDVVLSSKISLSRNISKIPFPSKMTTKDEENVYNLAKKMSLSIGYGIRFVSMKDIDELNIKSLEEKGILPNDFAKKKSKFKAILINDEENICILINGKNHIELQVFASGLDLKNLMNFAIEIDQKMEKYFDFSYSEKYGYLTSDISLAGTGLKATTYVHIPGVSMTGNVSRMMNTLSSLGVSISNFAYSDNSRSDIYSFTNNQTMGVSEDEIIKNINLVTSKVIEQERIARKSLAKQQIELEDRVYRNLGILENARKLTEDEILELLSTVKLGVDLGIIKELTDEKIAKIRIYTMSANLQIICDKKMDKYEEQIERAKLVKQIINEK